MASSLLTGVGIAAREPLVTGGLLYFLTLGPSNIRASLLSPFQSNLLARNGGTRLTAFITVLSCVTAANVLGWVSRALDRLAWNNWTFGSKPGAPFRFGPEKEELVVITGASSGFGYEMVKDFAKVSRVVALDVQDFPPELASLSEVDFYKCDITDTPAVEQLCGEIRKTHGEATVLINNAGIAVGKTILETTNAESEKLMRVNLLSHSVLIREFLPGMLRQKKGHIVTVASMASFFAAPGMLDYCMSKVGALFLTEGLRNECLSRYEGGETICTTSVHPSWHSTAILKGSEKALKKHGITPDPPRNVSDAIVEQVLAGRSGRLFIPKHEQSKAAVRTWPKWVQDVLTGNARRSGKKLDLSQLKTA